MPDPVRAHLVCGGRWHDMDFARLELLKLLGEHEEVRTRVAEDFRDTAALAAADFLVTYTCDLRVSEAEQDALAEFVAGGRRWLALHGTNSVFEFLRDGRVSAPRTHARLMRTLGSQFIAHPPVGRFRVRNACPEHPLVSGIGDFEVEDELYLCEYHGEIQPLLEARFRGTAPGFEEADWSGDEPRHVMYLHPEGRGEVLYLTLGHCRGRYDMRPLIDVYPRVERCAWESPVFYELLRRGLRWAKAGLPAE
jgi:type 1 glutamine amidotransferase